MRATVKRTLRRLGLNRMYRSAEPPADRISEPAEAIRHLTPPAPGVVTVVDASRHRQLELGELQALRLTALRFAGSNRRLVVTGVSSELQRQLISAGLAGLLRRDIAHDARVVVVHLPPRRPRLEM